MREVVDGVYELALGYVNVHVIVSDDGLVLVDTGLPKGVKVLERSLRSIGRSLDAVTTVLITHHHPDHAGSLAVVRERAGATAVAHAADAPHLTGAIPQARPTGFMAKLVTRAIGTPEPTKLDRLVTGDGGEVVPGIVAVHTPGRTRGHVSYLLDRAGGVLFAGDAATHIKGVLAGPPPGPATADAERAAESLGRLAELEFENAVFGHGQPIVGGAAERFRRP
ncbi:MBL fold metallo-hydrolase [Actinoplanes rectilineatus]|uniref:MBL fold metallo-hydrolase n=1 Tax=Actinoplanes rectilineatus TaxID=113571 RepID=UPI0005F2F4CD|nr:MBL fold metallo-hydrolase [Actinoplanes rectilineatus]